MTRFSVPVPMDLIQSVRLCHALAETRFLLCVEPADGEKFAHLARYFDFEYEVGHAAPLKRVSLSHEKPDTRIGSLWRPLIFPNGIVTRCRELWDQRARLASFRGLITAQRREILQAWQAGGGPEGREVRGVSILESRRGREFPTKCWDEDYFRTLGESEFVLCPAGDFAWTYRFFEGALCGAIPIVQDVADVYEGFQYVRMSEDPGRLEWSVEAAEANFEKARALLTAPQSELEKAIEYSIAE